ncbi:MAG: tripartite tricarboxylate transporter substrate binding protein [Xanthobacteraceae bacterium]
MATSTTRRRFLLGAAATPLLASGTLAQADFPSRPIRIVVGFPPGGGIDILARLIAPKMADRLGQPVIVENRAGANGLIATQGVAQSDADGYTILFGTMGNLAVNPTLYAGRVGIDMERDFIPLSHVASLPFTLSVNSALPVKSVAELIEFAKARPGKVFFGSSGIGGLPHLCGELLNLQAGIQTVHVPYSGSAPAFTDLARGQVQFDFDAYAITLPFIQSGYIRLLATTESTRLKALAGVPPMKDTLPNFDVGNWYGMVVRRGTSPAAVSRLNQEVVYALRQPDVAERADTLGLELIGTTPAQFGTFQREEIARWAEVIRTAKIQVE